MTTRRRVAAVLVVGAVLVGLTAGPAWAENELVVRFAEPAVNNAKVTVEGTVEHAGLGLLGGSVDRVTVTLVPVDGGARVGPVVACSPCGSAPTGFGVTIDVPTNGRYRVQGAADGKNALGLAESGSGSTPESEAFSVAAPPGAPQDVRVDLSPERIATVSWARNSEPDMLHYMVFRKDPGGESYRLVPGAATVPHPSSGRASFVDRGTAGAGGDYSYQVLAVRRGATANQPVFSERSSARPVTVPAPPPGDPAAAGAGGPTDPSSALSPDISAFAARPAPSPTLTPRLPEIPDTGYSSELPFGARPPGEELEQGEELAEPRSFEVETSTSEFVSRGRPLVPVAGGAVLLLLAIHLRLLNKRIKAVPATVTGRARTDLPVLELRPFDHADDALPTREPEPPPEPPRPMLFDYEQEVPPVDDDEWAERDDEVWEVMSSAR